MLSRTSRFSIPAETADVTFASNRERMGSQVLHVTLDLDRAVPRDDLLRASRSLVDAHPLLGCRYTRGLWRDRWVRDEAMDAGDIVTSEPTEDADAALRQLTRRWLDVLAGWPWRVVQLTTAGGGARLVITATGFREELTLQINGYDDEYGPDPARMAELLASTLGGSLA